MALGDALVLVVVLALFFVVPAAFGGLTARALKPRQRRPAAPSAAADYLAALTREDDIRAARARQGLAPSAHLATTPVAEPAPSRAPELPAHDLAAALATPPAPLEPAPMPESIAAPVTAQLEPALAEPALLAPPVPEPTVLAAPVPEPALLAPPVPEPALLAPPVPEPAEPGPVDRFAAALVAEMVVEADRAARAELALRERRRELARQRDIRDAGGAGGTYPRRVGGGG